MNAEAFLNHYMDGRQQTLSYNPFIHAVPRFPGTMFVLPATARRALPDEGDLGRPATSVPPTSMTLSQPG